MKKIKFKNKTTPPSGNPINDQNLNALQDNVEEAIGEINPSKWGLGTDVPIISNEDLNTFLTNRTGFYKGEKMTHAPNQSWFIVFHISFNVFYRKQIAMSPFNDEIYLRNCLNGTWGNWRMILSNQ